MDERYSSCACVISPGDAGAMLARSTISGKVVSLPIELAAVLRGFRAFRTIEEHLARLRAGTFVAKGASCRSPNPAPVVEKFIDRFITSGLLISETEVFRVAVQSESPHRPLRIVGSPTYGRNRELIRYLDSLDQYAAYSGRLVEAVVVDDARTGPGARTALEQTRNWSNSSLSVRYADRRQRGEFADLIARESGQDRHIVRFALLGLDELPNSGGATQNAIVLDAMGEKLVCLDDDMVARVVRAPQPVRGTAVTKRSDATQKWFFADESETLAHTRDFSADLLARHEDLLGVSLRVLLARRRDSGEPLDLDLHPDMVSDMVSDRARIAMTQGGFYGDSGSNGNGYFWMTGESRQRLLRSEAAYRAAVEGRQILVSAIRETITASGFCASGHFGVDTALLLPPFQPSMRGYDATFGLMLKVCHPTLYLGHVPLAVHHSPPSTRRQSFEGVWENTRCLDLDSILRLLIKNHEPAEPRTDGEGRLRSLGRWLSEAAAEPTDDFLNYITRLAKMQLEISALALEEQLADRAETPRFFKRYLRTYRRHIRDAPQCSRYVIPGEVVNAVGEEQAPEVTKSFIGTYGRLVRSWPEIVAAAGKLRNRGVRLSSQAARLKMASQM